MGNGMGVGGMVGEEEGGELGLVYYVKFKKIK